MGSLSISTTPVVAVTLPDALERLASHLWPLAPDLLTSLPEPHPLRLIRLVLLATLLLSLVGTVLELLLLEHFEDAWQWTPIALVGATLLVLGWYALERGPRSLNVFRVLMVLFLVSGALGILLHYRGNVEFELEMYPDMAGWKLFKETMMGATPALAPGSMMQIGLVGLAWTFRHPALRSPDHTHP